jgi:hypothetical protein
MVAAKKNALKKQTQLQQEIQKKKRSAGAANLNAAKQKVCRPL